MPDIYPWAMVAVFDSLPSITASTGAVLPGEELLLEVRRDGQGDLCGPRIEVAVDGGV